MIGDASTQVKLRVMQFNILADGLSGLDPRRGDFSRVAFETLSWNSRKHQILHEIIQYGPDIVTLQEVDHFYDYFLPELSARGFIGYFAPKPLSPSLEVSERSDGSCIFINSKLLRPISSQSFTYAVDESESLTQEEDYYSENRIITAG